jgi:DNA polymerase I
MKEIYVTNTETVVENNTPEIHLFGRDDIQRPDRIIVEGFEDYFYVHESQYKHIDPFDHDNLVRYEQGDFRGIDNSDDRIEIVPLVKVVVKNPRNKRDVADLFEKTWEADVDYVDRFRINHDFKTGVKAPEERVHVDEIEAVDKDAPPRVMTFDIETDDRGEGFPAAGKARILSIVAHDSYADETIGFIDMEGRSLGERFPDADLSSVEHPSDLGLEGLDKLEFEPDERRMLISFYSWVSERDFDVVAGWNSNGFDSPFVVERGSEVNANSDRMARVNGSYNGWGGPQIGGRSCFDLMDGWKDTKFTKVSGALDSAAQMELDDAKIDHQEKGFYELYDENTKKFLNYNAKDTRLTVEVNEAANVLGFKKALRDTIGLDFEDTEDNKDFITMLVRRKLDEKGLIGPTAVEPEDPGSYDGAYVFPAFNGLKKNIVGIDLASLYPNAMWMLNASPETKLGKIGRDFKQSWVEQIRVEGYEVAVSSNGVVFCLEEDGMFRELVDEALELKEYAGEKKQDDSLSEKEQAEWAEEYSVRKTIVNSIYGILGWIRFFLYDKDIASAITLTGQEVIKKTAKYVDDETIANVSYGDTDSNYIEFDSSLTQRDCLEATQEICDELNNEVYRDLADGLGMNTDVDGIDLPTRFEIEIEMYASHFFMSGQKKFYAYTKTWKEGMDFGAALNEGKGKLSISGYPCKKANTAKLTSQVQRDTLETIVRGGSKTEIREIIRTGADSIDARNPDFDLIGIPGGLGKELKDYTWTNSTPKGASPRAAFFGNLFVPDVNFGKDDTVTRVYLKNTVKEYDSKVYELDVIGFERGSQLDSIKDQLTVDIPRMQDTLIRSPMVDILEAVGIDVDAALEGQSQSGLGAFC